MNVMNIALDAWTLAMVAAATLCLCVSIVLWLRERGLLPVLSIASLRRKSFAELAVIAVIVGGFVQYGATKGTNGNVRSGLTSPAESAEAQSARLFADSQDPPARSVGGLCFAAIEPCTNGVGFAVALPPGGVTNNVLDLFCGLELKGVWSLLGEVDVVPSAVTAEVFIAMADLPGSPTNMPSAAFFAAGTHDDSDGDGLYDGRELRLHGTDPFRADTDGDGLSDGAEVAVGTDPLLRDTDGDGYPDDEEAAASTNPLVADAGASGTIRYVYDVDDRLAAAYVGASGGSSLTAWTPCGDATVTAERICH